MAEDFGTVNLKQGSQTREIELLRRHYRAHRDALSRLISDAPTEHLAAEYQRLITDIDTAVRKLDELEGKRATSIADTNPMIRTGPGTRPLVRPSEPAAPTPATANQPAAGSSPQSRIAIIVVAGIVVLAIIGWLIWRASSERKAATPSTEQPIMSTNAAPLPAVTPAPAAVLRLKITPAVADYGVIRKGTRAVRQFEITNSSDGVVEIDVARSTCRCLFYDYNGKLPAKGKESITVTVDGARAKAGPLQEEIEVHAKNDPSVTATFGVHATIK